MNDNLHLQLEKHVSGRSVSGKDVSLWLRQGLWSAIANTRTLAVVECHTTQDVQAAVRIARDHGLDVSALGGGHDWVGRSVCRDGITLDLRPLNIASFDRNRRSVIAGGGALAGTALACLGREDAIVTGVSKDVGLTGLALGGGYGKLNSRFGLVTDTLKSVEVVLADGRLVSASKMNEAELFWALRGAGKNFGIVTSAEYSVFALPNVLTGKVFYPLSQARSALKILQDLLEHEPEYLSVFSSFLAVPDLGFGLVLEPLWSGETMQGERCFDAIAGERDAFVLQRDWRPYSQVFDGDGNTSNGYGYEMDAYNIPRLSEDVIDAVAEMAAASPSPKNTIMFHDFHGVAAQIQERDTAFPLRENHFNMQVVASWAPGDTAGREKAEIWLGQIRQGMSPFDWRGGYPAVLGVDSRQRSRDFYGPSLKTIEGLKAKYDPDNRFSAALGLS